MEQARADASRQNLPGRSGDAAHVRTGLVLSRLRAVARRNPPGDWRVGRLPVDSRFAPRHAAEASRSGRSREIYSLSWHPDGRTLAVGGQLAGSNAWGIVVESLDGSRSDRLVSEPVQRGVHRGMAAGWTRAHCLDGLADSASIVRKDEGQPPQTILMERGWIRTVRISPDGRWLAYDIERRGPIHVYVVSISGKGERVQVSPRPSESPRWSHDGRRLFFRTGTAMMAVDVRTTGEEIELGAERKLFDAEMASEYAVGPERGLLYVGDRPRRRHADAHSAENAMVRRSRSPDARIGAAPVSASAAR